MEAYYAIESRYSLHEDFTHFLDNGVHSMCRNSNCGRSDNLKGKFKRLTNGARSKMDWAYQLHFWI
jgi:hypothetical protein